MTITVKDKAGLVPKLATAVDEYTPEQRRIINARLDEAEKGPFYGPFTANQAAAFLKKALKAARITGLFPHPKCATRQAPVAQPSANGMLKKANTWLAADQR
jgi:hypothetical protein